MQTFGKLTTPYHIDVCAALPICEFRSGTGKTYQSQFFIAIYFQNMSPDMSGYLGHGKNGSWGLHGHHPRHHAYTCKCGIPPMSSWEWKFIYIMLYTYS
jgi:hypothetical protein